MLTSLKIKNFRMLQDFVVPELGRVNLIVGKNNSGKSTVLEAIRIYAKQGLTHELEEILREHDEIDFRAFLPNHVSLTDAQEGIYIGNIEKTQFVELIVRNFDVSGEAMISQGRQDKPLSYIPTQLISTNDLAGLWDRAQLNGYDDHIGGALRLLDNTVRGISFIGSPKRVAMVKRNEGEIPTPLNSMGEGMARILQLVLSIVPAEGGFLLIDEFENGLHWEIQEKVWELVFTLAAKLDIQVFATTHSEDTLKAFNQVAQRSQEEGVAFQMAKSIENSNKGTVIALKYSEEDLDFVLKSGIEIR